MRRMPESVASGLALPDRLSPGLPHRLEGSKAIEAAPDRLASRRGRESEGRHVPNGDPGRTGRGGGTMHEREAFELEPCSAGRSAP